MLPNVEVFAQGSGLLQVQCDVAVTELVYLTDTESDGTLSFTFLIISF